MPVCEGLRLYASDRAINNEVSNLTGMTSFLPVDIAETDAVAKARTMRREWKDENGREVGGNLDRY